MSLDPRDKQRPTNSSRDISEGKLFGDFEAPDIRHSSRVKPAIVVREESTDTLVDNDTVREKEQFGTPIENKLMNSKLLGSDVYSSNPSLISDVSSECSELEEIYLEPENLHNKTDIAFAEDTDVPFEMRHVVLPTFEIDLNDAEPRVSSSDHNESNNNAFNHSASNHSASNHGASNYGASNHRSSHQRRNSDMREKLAPTQPKPVSNLTLRHTGMTKSHSSPSLVEIGCFGFRGEDYYRNCAHIVAEARQREKLRDFRGANEMLKAAVEILIAGVQHDPDPMRREGW